MLQRINAWSTRKKIIVGGIAAFALLIVIGAITGSQESTAPTQSTNPSVPPSAPESTSIPTPIPVGGLGISRDDIHRLLGMFDYGRVREESCPGTPCTSVESPNPNVKIWLYGPDTELHMAMVNGDNRDNDTDTGAAMAYLVNIVMPESSDRVVDWILTDATASLERKGGGGLERAIFGDKEVVLGLSSRSGGLTLTIKE